MKKDLISIYDLTREEINEILNRSAELKGLQRQKKAYQPLQGRTVALIFEKPSTRTRVSFEVGICQLGGHPLIMQAQETQLGRGESIADTARVLSRYVDSIVIRTYGHDRIEEMARYATCPVINGLSDLLHPCQVLSDLFTIKEKLGGIAGVKVAYIGDGNNVANSWLNAAARLEFDLWLATPGGYGPDPGILSRAKKEAGSRIHLTTDPREAAAGADVLYTDVWASMGQEQERAQRLEAFKGYTIDRGLLALAKPSTIVMHCLPAHRGEEIMDDVLDGPQSVVFDQAENRLHVQKAILTILLGGEDAKRD